MSKRYWKIIPSLLLFILVSVIVLTIMFFLEKRIVPASFSQKNPEWHTIFRIIENIFYWILIIIVIRIKKVSTVHYLNLRRISFLTIFKWLGIMLLFLAILSTICWITTGKLVVKINRFLPDFSWRLVIMGGISSVIVAPATEEMLMRGFLFKSIERSKLGKIGAVIITAFIFMLLHVENSLLAPYLWISILPLGLLCGMARAKTQSTFVAMGVHALYNFYLFIYDLIEAMP